MINSGRFGIYLVKKNYHSLPDEALKYMFIKILDVNNTVSQLLLKSSTFIMIPVWILPLTCARHTIIIKSKISPETNKN